MDQRAALLATTDILAASSARIADSRARMAETETVGVGILADLASQRRTLGNARDNVRWWLGRERRWVGVHMGWEWHPRGWWGGGGPCVDGDALVGCCSVPVMLCGLL